MDEYDKFGLSQRQFFGAALNPQATAVTRGSGMEGFGIDAGHAGMLYGNSPACKLKMHLCYHY